MHHNCKSIQVSIFIQIYLGTLFYGNLTGYPLIYKTAQPGLITKCMRIITSPSECHQHPCLLPSQFPASETIIAVFPTTHVPHGNFCIAASPHTEGTMPRQCLLYPPSPMFRLRASSPRSPRDFRFPERRPRGARTSGGSAGSGRPESPSFELKIGKAESHANCSPCPGPASYLTSSPPLRYVTCSISIGGWFCSYVSSHVFSGG